MCISSGFLATHSSLQPSVELKSSSISSGSSFQGAVLMLVWRFYPNNPGEQGAAICYCSTSVIPSTVWFCIEIQEVEYQPAPVSSTSSKDSRIHYLMDPSYFEQNIISGLEFVGFLEMVFRGSHNLPFKLTFGSYWTYLFCRDGNK